MLLSDKIFILFNDALIEIHALAPTSRYCIEYEKALGLLLQLKVAEFSVIADAEIPVGIKHGTANVEKFAAVEKGLDYPKNNLFVLETRSLMKQLNRLW